MKIDIPKEFKVEILNALNNSMIAFNDIILSFYLGCQVPSKWAEWQEKQNISSDECYNILNSEFSLLEYLYNQIENAEESMNKND